MMTHTEKKQIRRKPEKRREKRVAASLPVILARASGLTRDVSASGVFFETDTQFAQGSRIDITVKLTSPAGRMRLECQGEIVRVEQHGTRMGVAVKITDSVLSYVQD